MMTVGVADMKTSRQPGEIIMTYALGSCLGIAVHDPVAAVGGMLHVMLPNSQVNPEKAAVNPAMFVDTGLPALFKAVYALGGVKSRIRIAVAGGAGEDQVFAIGKRNFILLRKMLWTNGLMIAAHDTGGKAARNMYLEIGSGRVWIQTRGEERAL